jgi:hypothetical protein
MQKLIAANGKLQQKIAGKTTLKTLPTGYPRRRRCRLTKPFVALPVGYLNTIPKRFRSCLHTLIEKAAGGDYCEITHDDLAEELGCESDTARKLIYGLRNLGDIDYKPRKISSSKNHPNRYTFPRLAGFREPVAEAKIDHQIPRVLKALKTKTTPLPPTADAAGDGELSIPETKEPEKPQPSAEVHEALAEARRFRQERNRQRRMRRYEQNRERWVNRRQKPQTLQGEAARHILGLLGIPLSMTATREAVERSAGEWMRQKDCGVVAAVNGLMRAWRDYETTCWDWRIEYPCGMLTWFGECRWQKKYEHEWREIFGRQDAVTGFWWNKPRPVDTEAVWAKMKALGVSRDDEEEISFEQERNEWDTRHD